MKLRDHIWKLNLVVLMILVSSCSVFYKDTRIRGNELDKRILEFSSYITIHYKKKIYWVKSCDPVDLENSVNCVVELIPKDQLFIQPGEQDIHGEPVKTITENDLEMHLFMKELNLHSDSLVLIKGDKVRKIEYYNDGNHEDGYTSTERFLIDVLEKIPGVENTAE